MYWRKLNIYQRRHIARVYLICFAFCLQGCETLSYYSQAASGQWELITQANAISKVMVEPTVADEIKEQLRLTQSIRAFAIQTLMLPDNGSYQHYVHLDRNYVVWSVFASSKFAIEPIKSCYFIVGCLNYRGYFHERGAVDYASKLQAQGYDTFVGGVPAYSTLGWFKDPVLSTFIKRSERHLAALMFHEMAHQLLYISGDTEFNESFARTVEIEGVKRWLLIQGKRQQWERYQQEQIKRKQFVNLLRTFRQTFAMAMKKNSDMSDKSMLQVKNKHYQALQAQYKRMKTALWHGYGGYDDWFAKDLNNAKLLTVSTYYEYVPAFQVMLKRFDNDDLSGFYSAVRALAELQPKSRKQRLAALAKLSDGSL